MCYNYQNKYIILTQTAVTLKEIWRIPGWMCQALPRHSVRLTKTDVSASQRDDGSLPEINVWRSWTSDNPWHYVLVFRPNYVFMQILFSPLETKVQFPATLWPRGSGNGNEAETTKGGNSDCFKSRWPSFPFQISFSRLYSFLLPGPRQRNFTA